MLLDGEFSIRPNQPKTFARYHTIPHKVTNVSIHDKGAEPLGGSCRSSEPMIEAMVAPPKISRNAEGGAKRRPRFQRMGVKRGL